MASLGDLLRTARESQGRKLSQIADETRIQVRYLAAIEAEDWEVLPSGFLRKSFVRQYARILGVPETECDPVLQQLAAKEGPPLLPGQEPPRQGSELPPIVFEEPSPGHRYKLAAGVLAVVTVLAGCGALYSMWLSKQVRPPDQRQAVPQPTASEPTSNAPGPQQLGSSSRQAPQATEQRPIAMEVGRPTRIQAGGSLWIMIEAKESTWVKITSGRQQLFSGVLEPNQTKRLDGLENARVIVGNAGGLQIVSNGKPIGRIGMRGQVRVIKLTPEGAKITIPKLKIPSANLSPDIVGRSVAPTAQASATAD